MMRGSSASAAMEDAPHVPSVLEVLGGNVLGDGVVVDSMISPSGRETLPGATVHFNKRGFLLS